MFKIGFLWWRGHQQCSSYLPPCVFVFSVLFCFCFLCVFNCLLVCCCWVFFLSCFSQKSVLHSLRHFCIVFSGLQLVDLLRGTLRGMYPLRSEENYEMCPTCTSRSNGQVNGRGICGMYPKKFLKYKLRQNDLVHVFFLIQFICFRFVCFQRIKYQSNR